MGSSPTVVSVPPPPVYSLILKASFLGNPDFFTGLSLELPAPGAHPHIGRLLNSWNTSGSPVPEDPNHLATQGYANAALPMLEAAVSEESCFLLLS